MSLYYRDSRGYIGDAASNGGWADALPVLERAGGLLSDFAERGYSEEPLLLADALQAFLARSEGGFPPGVREILENMRKVAQKSRDCLILWDGTDERMTDEDMHDANFDQGDLDKVVPQHYREIEQDLDALEDDYRKLFHEVILAIRNDLEARIKQQRKSPTMDLKEFKSILQSMMERAHNQGRKDAVKEAHHASSFTPKAAIKWLKAKELQVSGIFSDGLLAGIKNILVNGLKNGTPVKNQVDQLYDLFEPYLGSKKLKDGVPPEPYKLNTLVRTNTTEAYNHGRLTEYLSPELLPYMQGIRYSAILDSKTTQVCRHLDGLVFKPTDPDLPNLTPPNHFNCRSILVPVMVGEKIKSFITKADKDKARQLADGKFI
jgi:SPP1 gp7 family putative phage head morphogenesis protein